MDNYEEWMRTRGVKEDITTREPRVLFKVVMVGDSGVGKTCLLERYRGKAFQGEGKSDATIGVDFYSRKLRVGPPVKEAAPLKIGSLSWLEDQPIIKMQIWDTAGHERFAAITRTYFRGVAGCVLVYDATRVETAKRLPEWLASVHELSRGARCLIVACKCDVLKEESSAVELGKKFAEDKGVMHVCLSARTSTLEEVEAAFRGLATSIYSELVRPMVLNGEVEAALGRMGGQFKVSYADRLQGRIMRDSVSLRHGVTFYLVPWLGPVTTRSGEEEEVGDAASGGGGVCPACAIL